MNDTNLEFELDGYRSRVAASGGRVDLTNKGARGEAKHTSFGLEDLVGVSFQPPSKSTSGWMHFSVRGGTAIPTKTLRAMNDPYVVVIRPNRRNVGAAVLALVDEYLDAHPTPERQAFAAGRHTNEARGSVDAGTDQQAPPAKVTPRDANRRDRIPRQAQRLFHKHVGDPTVRFVIAGMGGQCVVGLDSRCVVIKPGWKAGSTGGGRVTTIDYTDITSVQVHTGLMNGVLEIVTAAHSGSQNHDYWNLQRDHQVLKLPNCIPVAKRDLKRLTPTIEGLRSTISASKRREPDPAPLVTQGPQSPREGIAVRLRELADMHQSGLLTDDEFARSKAAVLDEAGP